MNPFDLAKSINQKKPWKEAIDVSPFVLIRIFSNTADTVRVANLANLQNFKTGYEAYHFLYGLVPKNPSRYGEWFKRADEDEKVKLVKQLYNYSTAKAIAAARLIPLETLRALTKKGGRA